jgi:hypothetical protein
LIIDTALHVLEPALSMKPSGRLFGSFCLFLLLDESEDSAGSIIQRVFHGHWKQLLDELGYEPYTNVDVTAVNLEETLAGLKKDQENGRAGKGVKGGKKKGGAGKEAKDRGRRKLKARLKIAPGELKWTSVGELTALDVDDVARRLELLDALGFCYQRGVGDKSVWNGATAKVSIEAWVNFVS